MGSPSPSAARRRAALWRSLATLVDAGIPPAQIASVLEAERGRDVDGVVAAACARELRAGGRLSAAARSVGLPAAVSEVLRAGEESGRLPRVLTRLADDAESEARWRARAWASLRGPLILLLALAFVGPVPLLASGGLGAYLTAAALVLALPALLGAALAMLLRAGVVPPGWRRPAHLAALVRFHRTFALAAGAGLPLPACTRHAGAAAGPLLQRPARELANRLAAGAGLAESLRALGLVPGLAAPLAAEAELTGRLDDVPDRIADLVGEDLARAIAWRLRIAAAVTFAIVVGAVVVRVVTGFAAVPGGPP